jgi:signal-transduction protein with cAMP-binding, CBS, and nucleotidyltransferase domain
MACRIEGFIRREIPLLDEQVSVSEGARLMAERNVGSLVVTRQGRVAGLFTERDLVRRVIGVGRKPEAVPLGDVCSESLITIEHDAPCLKAVAKMEAHGCRRLVAYRRGEYQGLVKLTDMAHALAEDGRKGKDVLLNALGMATIGAAVGVIVLLLSQLPNMLQLAERVTSP